MERIVWPFICQGFLYIASQYAAQPFFFLIFFYETIHFLYFTTIFIVTKCSFLKIILFVDFFIISI